MAIDKKYEAYLKSDKWRKKRLTRLWSDGRICQKCKTRKATQVHHKTYARIYNELQSDLMSVCKPCHRKIHGLDDNIKRSVVRSVLAKVISLVW